MLALTPTNLLPAAVQKMIAVERWVRVIAVDIVTAHWDELLMDGNNWLFYNNPQTALLEVHP
jgi:hypothetical protein